MCMISSVCVTCFRGGGGGGGGVWRMHVCTLPVHVRSVILNEGTVS